MNTTQVNTTFQSALSFLSQGRLKNAFDKTTILANELQEGRYIDRCNELQQNYQYLLRYYFDGVDDPQRKVVYNRMLSRLFVLNTEVREELLHRNSDNFEYTQKRYFPHRLRFSDYGSLFDALNYYHIQKNIIKDSVDDHDNHLSNIRQNFEQLLPDLFSIFWLSTSFDNKEKQLFSSLMADSYPGEMEKMLVLSALTLNLWRMFDESKLLLLLDMCSSSIPGVRQRALVGLCFVLARHNRFIPYFPQIRNRLVLLTDDSQIAENLSNIFIQIISTNETDKITKKMQEEILPEMMKISPLLKDSMEADNLLESDEWEEGNPEWQEIIESSGVGDKLRELSEMQLEGADVYMSTFSLLKNFRFFNEISNWFMTFDTQNSDISDLFESDDASLMNAFVGNNAMCNSDKYSFCLSIMQMPLQQRNSLKQSFKMETDQLQEMAKDEALLSPNLMAKNISKQYIQDLFRFFKLNPHRIDFSDMFGSTLNLHSSFLFDILSSNSDLKATIAEYYFSKAHYKQAIELFDELIGEQSPSASLQQKVGFAYQKTTQLSAALDAYLKADMLHPDDLWTVKKIALCYRLLGNNEKALEYYQHADYLQPDQQSTQMNIGQCLLQLSRYSEALKLFYKLDALHDNNIKVWRALSWTLFVLKNYEQADYYIAKLINNEPNKYDWMNAAHIAWCSRNVAQALSYYGKSLRLFDNNFDLFLELFNQDKLYLLSNGIDADEILLMLDQLLYVDH